MSVNYPNGGRVPRKTWSHVVNDDSKELVKPLPKRGSRRRKRGPGPEHRIQDNIIAALKMAGHHVWRMNVGKVKMDDGRMFSAGAPKGFPDVCGYRKGDGKIFFIEVKTNTGKRSPAQVYFAKDIANDPVIYGVARSAQEALDIVTQGLNRTEDIKK